MKPIKIRLNIEVEFDEPTNAGIFIAELIQAIAPDDEEAREILKTLAEAVQERLINNPPDESSPDA